MPGDEILADRGFPLQEDFALNSGGKNSFQPVKLSQREKLNSY